MDARWYGRIKNDWKKQLAAVLFITVVAMVGESTGLTLLLFPELGALADGVIARPNHPWAQDLGRLIATPTITGVIGMLTMRYLGWGPLQVLLVLVASLGVVALLRSIVFPALSAGILPLVLGQSDWVYPACIFTSCTALAIAAYVLRHGSAESRDVAKGVKASVTWETPRLLVYLCFVTLIASAAYLLSQPLLLFPPLAVLAFEALVRTKTCAWINRPVALVCLFLFSSTGGHAIFYLLGVSPLPVMFATIFAIMCMAWLDLYAPPAIAIAILPYATVKAGWLYPIEVGLSVATLAIVFTVIERMKMVDYCWGRIENR